MGENLSLSKDVENGSLTRWRGKLESDDEEEEEEGKPADDEEHEEEVRENGEVIKSRLWIICENPGWTLLKSSLSFSDPTATR